MGTNGYATITIVDNGGASIIVPNQSVQVVMGCCSSGVANQVVASRSPTSLNNTLGWGPLVEAAALACAAGGTVLAIKTPPATPGTATAITHTGTGTSVVTTTLDGTNGAFDTYYVKIVVMVNSTIGTSGQIQISLDAGRNYSPTINLGTAVTYVIPGTGITLNFAAGTLVAGDTFTFSTAEPLWNQAGLLAAFNAFQASPYAQQGFGSIHIPGKAAGTDATTEGGYLETWASAIAPLFGDVIISARDAINPVAWGGAGETEATWMASLLTSYSAVAQKRVSACAAYWNIPSALVNPLGVVPAFRRSIAYSVAARTTQIAPNRSWGRVKFGAMPFVVVDPINDPKDGFIYHDESINPSLNAGRFVTTTRRSYLQGVYVLQANNMAATGAQINSRPLMAVIDVAATILQQVGQLYINDDVRLLKTGTLDPRDAIVIQKTLQAALDAQMTSQQMISSASVVIDQTANVQTTGIVPVTATIVARGIILQVNITLQYNNPALV
jgi:hypothetical protein